MIYKQESGSSGSGVKTGSGKQNPGAEFQPLRILEHLEINVQIRKVAFLAVALERQPNWTEDAAMKGFVWGIAESVFSHPRICEAFAARPEAIKEQNEFLDLVGEALAAHTSIYFQLCSHLKPQWLRHEYFEHVLKALETTNPLACFRLFKAGEDISEPAISHELIVMAKKLRNRNGITIRETSRNTALKMRIIGLSREGKITPENAEEIIAEYANRIPAEKMPPCFAGNAVRYRTDAALSMMEDLEKGMALNWNTEGLVILPAKGFYWLLPVTRYLDVAGLEVLEVENREFFESMEHRVHVLITDNDNYALLLQRGSELGEMEVQMWVQRAFNARLGISRGLLESERIEVENYAAGAFFSDEEMLSDVFGGLGKELNEAGRAGTFEQFLRDVFAAVKEEEPLKNADENAFIEAIKEQGLDNLEGIRKNSRERLNKFYSDRTGLAYDEIIAYLSGLTPLNY